MWRGRWNQQLGETYRLHLQEREGKAPPKHWYIFTNFTASQLEFGDINTWELHISKLNEVLI
jgi:hypothetical protein